MSPPPIVNTRRALGVWSLTLTAALVGLVVLNFAEMRYARQVRERDYRTYLVAAAELTRRFDYPAAFRQVEAAKSRAPEASEPHAMAGHIQYQVKHWRQAVDEYTRAIELGNTDEGVRLNLVWALIELKRYEEAAACGIESMDEELANPAFPRYVAEAYYRAGKIAEAIPYYEEALTGYPNDLYLLDHLVQAYRSTRQIDKAEQIRQRIAEVESAMGAPSAP